MSMTNDRSAGVCVSPDAVNTPPRARTLVGFAAIFNDLYARLSCGVDLPVIGFATYEDTPARQYPDEWLTASQRIALDQLTPGDTYALACVACTDGRAVPVDQVAGYSHLVGTDD
ncbi:hypothetical protein [Corynebacterium argentoratense]|uniref:hypothetical protein n=1 Tax=Corynebacterium argentoratense TaxID=42817 RepID=UPI001F336D53|nr:hypothetical protein [Corynebacterium argentoratense]MCF1765219.1 hypothetical protein [Corynebacterium argentoratense]